MTRAAGIAALLLCCGACYTFSPAELASVPTGEEIRVYLSSEGAARLAEAEQEGLIDSASPVVTGTLAERRGDAVSIMIPVARRQVGFLQERLAQQVTLPAASIVALETKHLNALRTTAAVVGATAAVGTFVVLIIRGARSSVEPPYEYPVDFRAPGLTFTLRTPGWR